MEKTSEIFSLDSCSTRIVSIKPNLILKLFDENQNVAAQNDKESTNGKPNPFLEIVWSLHIFIHFVRHYSDAFDVLNKSPKYVFSLFCYLWICILRVDLFSVIKRRETGIFFPFLYLSFLQTSIYQNARFLFDHRDVSSECVQITTKIW